MIKNPIPFGEFEKAAMQKLLEDDTPTNQILREQYRNVHIVSRDFTEGGFYTDFKIPEGIARVAEPLNYSYGHATCDINGIKILGGLILFVENGTLLFLEGFTYVDPWPEKIFEYHVYK